jgi:broad specificity phosphatase PhoE
MYLLLIRHLESDKNVREAFSSDSDNEPLTERSRREIAAWSKSICRWVRSTRGTVARVHCTASVRARDSAASIAARLGVPLVEYDSLRSTHPGSLAGKSADEARKSNPEFMKQLQLYRKGLFNSYNFTVAENKEPKVAFEARIASCLEKIMCAADEDVKIVVTHRAPITAMLTAVARSAYNYPDDFSGYVELTLGHASLLERVGEHKWEIHEVNISAHELSQLATRRVCFKCSPRAIREPET